MQRRLRGKGVTIEQRRRDDPDFPFRRFVRCGTCGMPLTGSRSRGRSESYPYYHCRRGCTGITVRKHVLEGRFLDVLTNLEPQPRYLRLFRAVVLDLWRSERQRAADICSALEQRSADVRQRISRVEEAFLFQRSIDQHTYQNQLARLREELAVADMQLAEAKVEQIDVEGVVAFAEHVIGNVSALWSNASLENRRALQQAILPDGIAWTPSGFGTAVTSAAFSYLLAISPDVDGVWRPRRD